MSFCCAALVLCGKKFRMADTDTAMMPNATLKKEGEKTVRRDSPSLVEIRGGERRRSEAAAGRRGIADGCL